MLALTFLSQVSALTFSSPFDLPGFSIHGDAKIAENELRLASNPHEQGAVWADEIVSWEEWTLEAVIRSKADISTDVGKSGFTLWYTDKINLLGDVHGGSDRWDGLAVMVDSLASKGMGSVRGHLNDGTIDFLKSKDVEKESLSLCQIAYRNAAGQITVRIGYSSEGFVVDVNGQKCFMSTEITLPNGYFGISANSDVSGDVFVVDKLAVHPGMKPGLLQHLPQQKDHVKEVETETETKVETEKNQDGRYREEKHQAKKEVHQVENAHHDTLSQSINDLAKVIEPISTKIELLSLKVEQIQSVVDQLVETLSLSMGQSKKPTDAQDLTPILKELKALKTQVSEVQYSSAPISDSGKPAVGFWKLAFTLPIPTIVALLIFNMISKKRNTHNKLL